MRVLFLIFLNLLANQLIAQGPYPPPAGQTGSSAIYKDSSAIVSWASSALIERGWQNIADTSFGKTTASLTAKNSCK